MAPSIPVPRVQETINKLVVLVNRVCVSLVVCLDGVYHPYKGSVNQKCTENWESAHERIIKLFEGPNPGRDVEEGKKVMKRAVKICEEILTTAVDIFKVHDIL